MIVWGATTMVQILVLAARSPDWQAVWPLASAIADQAVIFAAPVIAASACAITQRRRRQWASDLRLVVPRPTWQQRFADLGSLVLVAVASGVTGHVIAWVWAASSGATGQLRPWYVLLTSATLAFAALIGYGVGRALRAWLAAPVTALAVLLGMLVWPTDDLPFWYVINGWPQLTVSPSILVGRWIWFISAAAALVVVSRRRPTASAVTVVLAAVVTLVGANLGAPLTMAVAHGQVCTEGALAVCLWPDNAVHLGEVSTLADEVVLAVAGTVPVPQQPLLEEGLATGHPELSQFSSAVSVRGDAADIVFSLTTAWIDQFPSCPELGSAGEDSTDYVLWTQWVLERVGEATQTTMTIWDLDATQASELTAVRSLPEAEQLSWAAERAKAAQRCP